MQSIARNYRSLSLLIDLNVDRLLMVSAMLGALVLGGMIGTML
jgi:hypothetical protein